MRERFFAMVNHELRNALAAVFGWAEMLVRKKDPTTVPPAAYEVTIFFTDAAERDRITAPQANLTYGKWVFPTATRYRAASAPERPSTK